MDAEWSILYNKLDKIHQSGAKVVLSKLPIGDVATQYFADRYKQCFSVNDIVIVLLMSVLSNMTYHSTCVCNLLYACGK